MGAEDDSGKKAAMIRKLAVVFMRYVPRTGPGRKSTPYTQELVEERIRTMFPDLRVPDHPPFSLMIEQAIVKLNEEGGSTEESILECITSEYDSLPLAHASFLRHHLKKLCDREEIIYTRDKRYMLRLDGTDNVRPAASKEKFERCHGRKHGRRVQKEISNREKSLERKDLLAMQVCGRKRTPVPINRRKRIGFLSSGVNLDGDRAAQSEMQINLPNSELATKGRPHIKDCEKDFLSRCTQHHRSEETDQATEDTINGIGKPMEKRVEVSARQYIMEEPFVMEQDLRVTEHAEPDEQHDQQADVLMAQQYQVETQPLSAEDAEEPIGVHKTLPPEVLCQQMLTQLKETEDLVERLKRMVEAHGNDILPHDKCLEFLRRNRAMEFSFLEMLKASSESTIGKQMGNQV